MAQDHQKSDHIVQAGLPLGVDVIIRFHDIERLYELDRALLSLACQSWPNVRAIVVVQNFDRERLERLNATIAKYDWAAFDKPEPLVVNAEAPPGDQRSLLLNVGLANASHRFVAFLDSDDYVYEDCYEYLVGEALKVRAAVAFGGIVMKKVIGLKTFVYNLDLDKGGFSGKGRDDLLRDNFCPIHSFVVDRERVSAADLKFDERLTRLEDYDFLLRGLFQISLSLRIARKIRRRLQLASRRTGFDPVRARSRR
jgi:glycosyltransferase involved in cell wall biosynthesis